MMGDPIKCYHTKLHVSVSRGFQRIFGTLDSAPWVAACNSNRIGVSRRSKNSGDAGPPLPWDGAWLTPSQKKHTPAPTCVTIPNLYALGLAT